MTGVLVGIDVGTSGAKVVVTDAAGRRIAEASERYPTATQGSSAEQDARHWWAAVCRAASTAVAGRPTAAVAVTSQAPTLVPVDSAGDPTAPALTWLDRRASREAEEIAALVPDSRNGADPFFGTSKLPWLARHRRSALDQATAILSTNGYIVRQLTGVSTLDRSTASLMQGFDDAEGRFDKRLLGSFPEIGLLPESADSDAIVGRVTASASEATGIAEGTPVVAGGIDAIGSAIEAGAFAPGDSLVDMVGFSSATILPVPRGTAVPGFIHARHCVPDVDLLITAQVTAGATIDWVNGLDRSRDLRSEDALAGKSRPGRVLMVPSLAGERTPSWNPSARGIIDGIDLDTDGSDLMIAAMEGNALAMAADVRVLRERGFVIDRVIATGGGATSDTWLQIKADVLGVPVVRPESGHGAAEGAALLAGRALGLFDDLGVLRELASRVDRVFLPNEALTAAYERAQERYEQLAALNEGRRAG
jgi:xylulokinase